MTFEIFNREDNQIPLNNKCIEQFKLTFSLYVRIKPNSLFKRTAGGCLLRSSPGLSGRVTPAELTCTNLHTNAISDCYCSTIRSQNTTICLCLHQSIFVKLCLSHVHFRFGCVTKF